MKQQAILQLISRFERLPRPVAWMILAFATALIGLLDYETGYEASVSVLYLIPVLIAAWSIDLKAGLVIALVESTTLTLSDWLAGQAYSEPWLIVWNIVIRGAVYAMVAYLAATLRDHLAKAQHLSLTDELTGAWNRRAFYQEITKEVTRTIRSFQPFSIVYIDIDDFKIINDRLGHEAGDRVLQAVVSICSETLRQSDTVARLGGDEFVLLLPNTNSAELRDFLPRLLDELGSASRKGHRVSFSVGALTCVHPPSSIEEVLQDTDALMYKVKHAGKDNIQYLVYPAA